MFGQGGEQEADFAHVSRVFGRMLSARRYVDVVATDVAAGLILLRHVQKAEVRSLASCEKGKRLHSCVCVCVGFVLEHGSTVASQLTVLVLYSGASSAVYSRLTFRQEDTSRCGTKFMGCAAS